MKKKLYLSNDDCWIGGVCGGIAQYFGGIDSNVLRLIVVGLFLCPTIPIGLAYIILWICMPSEENEENELIK